MQVATQCEVVGVGWVWNTLDKDSTYCPMSYTVFQNKLISHFLH